VSFQSQQQQPQMLDTLDDLALTHYQTITNKIHMNSIFHHAQCGNHFFYGDMSKNSSAIRPLFKESVM
jgi:hypothetical protein